MSDVQVSYVVEHTMHATVRLSDAEWAEYLEWLDGGESNGHDLAEFLRSSRDGDQWWIDRIDGEEKTVDVSAPTELEVRS